MHNLKQNQGRVGGKQKIQLNSINSRVDFTKVMKSDPIYICFVSNNFFSNCQASVKNRQMFEPAINFTFSDWLKLMFC